MSDTQDFIRRDDVLAACDIAPPDEWNDYTKGGYDFAAEECKRNIAALPAIDPAAIREAALREAAAIAQGYHEKALEWAKKVRGLEQYVGETDSLRIANAILALIGEANCVIGETK